MKDTCPEYPTDSLSKLSFLPENHQVLSVDQLPGPSWCQETSGGSHGFRQGQHPWQGRLFGIFPWDDHLGDRHFCWLILNEFVFGWCFCFFVIAFDLFVDCLNVYWCCTHVLIYVLTFRVQKMPFDKGIVNMVISIWFNVSPWRQVIQTITPYIEREDFDPAAIKKASVACEALCLWVWELSFFLFFFSRKSLDLKLCWTLLDSKSLYSIIQLMASSSKSSSGCFLFLFSAAVTSSHQQVRAMYKYHFVAKAVELDAELVYDEERTVQLLAYQLVDSRLAHVPSFFFDRIHASKYNTYFYWFCWLLLW